MLSTRLDSLKTVQSSENLSYTKRKTELETSISNSDQKSSELLNNLSTKKENLQNQITENQKLDQAILSLKLELKSVEDSIQKIIEEQPIKFLDSSLINKSDEELIQLMNVRDIDLGTEFINEWEPNRKPEFSILGKQFFGLQGKKYCLVIVGVQNPNDFHGAYGTNFIAIFEIQNSIWNLLNEPLNTNGISYGGWGHSAVLDKFILLGEKSLAVILVGGFTGTGLFTENRTIFGIDNQLKIFSIYKGQVTVNDQGNKGSTWFQNIDEQYYIEFKKSTNSDYYDLIETKKSHGKKVKTTILKFNENTMKYE